MASDLRGTKLSELLSFVGFPQVKTLHKRVMFLYEYRVWGTLRKIAKGEIEEGKLLEVRIQLERDISV